MSDFFCPMPWKGIFVHTNKVGVCCVSSKMFNNISPNDFLNSDYLKDLQDKFLRNEIDDTCKVCVASEKKGLYSMRQYALKLYGEDTNKNLEHIELRASNLCNFACKMCHHSNSSLISGNVENISEEHWQQILDNSKTLNDITLTGGEPFIIKRYYEYLDYLIENEKSDITLRVFTNCSVYNQKFIDKILRFKTCYLIMSIDGVEKFAETQRTNSVWKTVDENIHKFITLPINLTFNTVLTNITVLGIDELIKYYIQLKDIRPDINFMCHTPEAPSHLLISNMYPGFKDIAIEKIDIALSLMKDKCFDQFRVELENNKKILEKYE